MLVYALPSLNPPTASDRRPTQTSSGRRLRRIEQRNSASELLGDPEKPLHSGLGCRTPLKALTEITTGATAA
jgi:hypothetical protein